MEFSTREAETILSKAVPANAGLGNVVAYADKVAEHFYQYCTKPDWDKPEDEATVRAKERIEKYVRKCMTVTAPSASDNQEAALKEHLSKVARRLAKFFEEKIVNDPALN